MLMPKRSYSASSGYRYGFNGKENDNDVKGLGNQQDYGMRIYDPRLGRFLSVDPLSKSYAMFTTYQYASNRPIDGIDLDGQEFLPYQKSMYRLEYKVKTPITNASIIVKTVYENIPGPLQDAKNRSFKYVGYGPVTAFGRDWDVSIDGPTIYEEGKYYNKGPNIYGTAEGGKSTQ